MRREARVRAPGEVVIVAIDEESAQKLGVSDKPRDWPRGLHAELVRYLVQAGARIIVFDLTFEAPSLQSEQDLTELEIRAFQARV
ncbi:MAG TPA: CHASE2 domain-containing protein [Caldimonas sp.]